MRIGNNYSGARWTFRARSKRPDSTTEAVPRVDQPRCQSCGNRFSIINGGQRCYTLPGAPGCERDSRTHNSSGEGKSEGKAT